MPPKRQAAAAAGGNGPSKRTKSSSTKKTATDDADDADDANIPTSARWAAVSVSKNVASSYHTVTKDKSKAYTYKCSCPERFGNKRQRGSDDEDDEDEEDEDDEDEEVDPKGCGTKVCVCKDAPDKHPGHPWLVTDAGKQKFYGQVTMAALRDPDNFGMYTFNDHMAYGVVEVLQNLMIDFNEAEEVEHGTWEQWVVCEAMVLFLNLSQGRDFILVEDGELARTTLCLIGRMFLTMLARLEREDKLSPTSEVRNIAPVMAAYIGVAHEMRSDKYDVLEDRGDKTKKGGAKGFSYNEARFDDHVAAYAKKHGIKLGDDDDGRLGRLGALAGKCDAGAGLPAPGADPWSWKAAWREYVKEYDGLPLPGRGGCVRVGGDRLDITTWSSKERKAASFGGKDPLGPKELKMIKEGMVLMMR